MKDARAELARIDASGTAHPIGTVASQRMRAREGAYRVLPAPGHVVFMRFTGEDGRRDSEDGAVVRLAGEITAPAGMCDVLAMLSQTGWRGELVVLDGESSRCLFLDGGNVVGGQTTVDDERIGMVMYRFGALSPEQHELVMERVHEGARFGEAVVALGLASQERVYSFIGKQIEEIVFATFAVADGTFFFLDGFDEARLASHHSISASALLMDGVTRLDEVKYFRQKVPTSDHVPVRLVTSKAPPEDLAEVLAAVDGRLSVEELGRHTGKGEFETTRAIYSLVQSKHVAIHPPRISGGPAAVVAAANSALGIVHRVADAAGKGTAVRESLESFAVGAGVYDILFRGAGPDESGILDAERVAANTSVVAGGADPEEFLKQTLHEYVSFAIFAAGSALGSDAERELTRDLRPFLDLLHVAR